MSGPSGSDITTLRRFIGDTGASPAYTDEQISEVIARYPTVDFDGKEPTRLADDGSSVVPNEYWLPTYDLHAAAADLWNEMAAGYITQHDFSADGGQYSRSQIYQQMMARSRYHNSRRKGKIIKVKPQSDSQGGTSGTTAVPSS